MSVAPSCLLRRAVRVSSCGLIVLLFFAASTQASTTVTGDDDRTSPLVIEPSGTGTVHDAQNMVMFIQKMPVTKTVNRVTLGDIGLDPGCTYTGPVLKLFIRQHPTGQIGTETSSLYWEGNALEEIAADTDLEPRTWRTEPITFVKGRGYSFWVQGTINGCNSYKVRSWPHNHSQVNAGDERCDRVVGNSFRMWHESGQNDAVPCPYNSVPENFDLGMPEGWLSVNQSWGSSYVETTEFFEHGPEPPQPACPYPLGDYGGFAERWRSAVWNSDWGEYVCLWDQRYPDWLSPSSPFYPNDPADGWYYGLGWTNPTSDWPRDMYVKLDLDEDELAAHYRPNLYFDSSEKWRPLDLDQFFDERDATNEFLHRLCQPLVGGPPGPPEWTCAPAGSPDALTDFNDPDGYLKINGLDASEPEDYQSPNEACTTDGLYDCNGGTISAQYYYVSAPIGDIDYRYIGYWAFYRYNHFLDGASDFDHEGDWEGLAVAPSYERPGTFDFASFSAHTHWWSYLRDTLGCDDGDWWDTCGTDTDRYGAHLRSYVANGTHANYPTSCSEVIPALTCEQPDGSTPERGYDGARGWGNNWPYVAESVALRPFPALGTGRWVDWLGHWGGTRTQSGSASPDSPGNQAHYLEPWDQCGDNGEYCPTAARSNRPPRRASPAPTACRSWFGPNITAVSCDTRRIKQAVRRRQLGRPGTARAALVQRGTTAARTKRHRRRIGRAPGLVQILSKPLSHGDSLRLSGRASQANIVLVRYRLRGHSYEATFKNVPLRPGRPATLRVTRRSIRLQVGRGGTRSPNRVVRLRNRTPSEGRNANP
jgi:hypothetical protein